MHCSGDSVAGCVMISVVANIRRYERVDDVISMLYSMSGK